MVSVFSMFSSKAPSRRSHSAASSNHDRRLVPYTHQAPPSPTRIRSRSGSEYSVGRSSTLPVPLSHSGRLDTLTEVAESGGFDGLPGPQYFAEKYRRQQAGEEAPLEPVNGKHRMFYDEGGNDRFYAATEVPSRFSPSEAPSRRSATSRRSGRAESANVDRGKWDDNSTVLPDDSISQVDYQPSRGPPREGSQRGSTFSRAQSAFQGAPQEESRYASESGGRSHSTYSRQASSTRQPSRSSPAKAPSESGQLFSDEEFQAIRARGRRS